MARHFGRNIAINGHSVGPLQTVYEGQVHNCLLSIIMFRTGRAVIEHIWRAHRHVTIVPWHSSEENADSAPVDGRGATRAGEPVRDGRARHEPAWGRGTGRGSNSVVRFTPWIFRTEILPRWDPIAMHNWQAVLGWQPVDAGRDMDHVLLHELVHSFEQLYGRVSNAHLGHRLDTVSEFHAILVANLQARERTEPARLNHAGYRTAVSPRDVIPNENEFWALVEVFRLRHRELAADLAAIPVSGNPFGGRAAFHETWPPIA